MKREGSLMSWTRENSCTRALTGPKFPEAIAYCINGGKNTPMASLIFD